MLGTDIDSVGWPRCGEIDIMEYVSKEPNRIWGTIHGQGYSGGGSFGGHYDFDGPAATEFHTFTIEWGSGSIKWFVDGILYHTATPEDVAGTGRVPNDWYFDHPFFMILNIAVGGNWGGPLDPGLTFPVQMEVDYVRVYQADYGMFNGFPKTGDWIDTGAMMGWVNVADYPWVYVEATGGYAYAAPSETSSGWLYFRK
jgi:beta-glucanase (GH16 family)